MARLLRIFLVMALLIAAMPVSAKTEVENQTDTLLSQSDSNVKYLGKAFDKSGREVEGFQIIHYKKKDGQAKGGPGKPGSVKCYGYLADGAKWKSVEDYYFNPANNSGLDNSVLFSTLVNSVGKWEDATDGHVNGSASADVFGTGFWTNASLAADAAAPDDVNEVYFGSISSPGAIAVTTVWGIFSGPTFSRELVEWDMVFDEEDYAWSLAGEAGKMDFENIATHELGHSAGLADLYNTCSEETMFGYANFAEIKKRTLNSGDLTGMNNMY